MKILQKINKDENSYIKMFIMLGIGFILGMVVLGYIFMYYEIPRMNECDSNTIKDLKSENIIQRHKIQQLEQTIKFQNKMLNKYEISDSKRVINL